MISFVGWSVHPGLLSSDAFAFAGAGSRGEGKGTFGGVGVPGSGVLPGAGGQDDAVVEGPTPGVEFAARVPLGAAVVDAGPAQRGEGDRITARLGQEVASVAQGVGPPVEPERGGGRFFAEGPGGGDEPLVVLVAGQCVDLNSGADRPQGQSWGADGLGSVFGDVVGDRPGRQRLAGAGQAAGVADGPDVGLCAESQDAPEQRVVSGDGGGVVTDRGYGGADGLLDKLGGVARRRGLVTLTWASRRMTAW